MKESKDAETGEVDYELLFWLYYPEWREILATYDAFNPINDAQRRSYEDLFEKRFFSSYIIKESNVYDRPISAYAKGLDALAESSASRKSSSC